MTTTIRRGFDRVKLTIYTNYSVCIHWIAEDEVTRRDRSVFTLLGVSNCPEALEHKQKSTADEANLRI